MCVFCCHIFLCDTQRFSRGRGEEADGREAGRAKHTHFQMEFKGGIKRASQFYLSRPLLGILNAGISTMQMSVWEPERSATASQRSGTAACKRSGAKHSASEMDGAAYFRYNMWRKTVRVCERSSSGGERL